MYGRRRWALKIKSDNYSPRMKQGLNTDGDKFLIFDFRFLIGGEEKFGTWKQAAGPEAGVPTKTREAGSCGKRRGFTALSGREIGKTRNFYRLATGFSHFETALTHLFPRFSTQVVDFPHLAMVRLFREVMNLVLATDGTRMQEGQIYKEGWNGGKQERKTKG